MHRIRTGTRTKIQLDLNLQIVCVEKLIEKAKLHKIFCTRVILNMYVSYRMRPHIMICVMCVCVQSKKIEMRVISGRTGQTVLPGVIYRPLRLSTPRW